MIKHTFTLAGKDFLLELKRPYLLNGMLLYVVSTVFICYLAFDGIIDERTWNVLYWIVILFASVNSAGRSFSEEFSKRHLYYYSIANPAAIILGKMCYNAVLLVIVALLGFSAFSLFLGIPVENRVMFILAAIAGSISFALLLTMVAGIASRAEQNFTLMAILSFPIALPKLLILINLTRNAIERGIWSEVIKPFASLIVLQILIIVLALLLFPYLWKD